MSISKKEAMDALADADKVSEATRLTANYAGTDLVVMAWGIIWFMGFIWSHIVVLQEWPGVYHSLWFVLIALGMVVTLMTEKSLSAPVKNTVGRRIGFFWMALYGYIFLGMAIFSPYLNYPVFNSTPGGAKAIAAMNTIIPMFAYVVMGLWLGMGSFIYMGVGLTALTVVAYFLFNPIFFPFMALVGGGILFGCGLSMRMRWKSALRKIDHANEY
jgi:hypothetical protein